MVPARRRQGQNLALTVLHVPSLLNSKHHGAFFSVSLLLLYSGSNCDSALVRWCCAQGYLAHTKQSPRHLAEGCHKARRHHGAFFPALLLLIFFLFFITLKPRIE